MDFYAIKTRSLKGGKVELYADFRVGPIKDLMVRGRAFYAIWDEEAKMWSTNEYDVQRIVDADLRKEFEHIRGIMEQPIIVRWLSDFSTGGWKDYRSYISQIADTSHQLDANLTFSNTEVRREDYASKRLPYPLEAGSYEAFDKIIGTLYDPAEREKIEWAIGAIVSGDAKEIQKFLVFYGDPGSGKSTVLNIIQKLFQGYYSSFEAKSLASSNNAFATEVFRGNPLVAIQHDGDLSRIEDNTKFNSIVSHEEMSLNEKYKSAYTARINAFLMMATNLPVKISDSKSGIIRRLIDVNPSGRKLPIRQYNALMSKIDFELGAIAYHCLEVYRELGKNYYDGYRPLEMMYQTDLFFNFVEDNFITFKEEDGVALKRAWAMYKEYCDEAAAPFKLPMHKFRAELKSYFKEFYERYWDGDKSIRSYYKGFKASKFTASSGGKKEEEHPISLCLDCTESLLDEMLKDCPAQYATPNDTPMQKWENVRTTLKDIETSKVHYVRVPENHIVIDFDLKDEEGNKSYERNLEVADKWPATYAELSKGGAGIHLHYIYDGDVSELSRVYDTNIEIKVFSGNSSLRRRVTRCNNIPVAHISSGLPLKGVKPMINQDIVMNERRIRDMIKRNLAKEIHPNTRPSIDFIFKILDEAYNNGVKYDVTDLRPAVLAFANSATNQSSYCIKQVAKMQFKSDEPSIDEGFSDDTPFVFWDVEVFPNLFLLNWKFAGEPKCTRMINPSGDEVSELFNYRLIGFNNRRYDNHILYARYIGYDNEQLYDLSQRIISGSKNCFFGEAYNLSYTDVYDFCAKKQSLKKWEIELGIHHKELGLPWDQPVPEDRWVEVAEYCDNDVIATEAVFNANQGDYKARLILADLSGLTPNDTTNTHTKTIIFGNNRKPQSSHNYWNLGEPVTNLSDDTKRYLEENTSLPFEFNPPPHLEWGTDSQMQKSVLPYFPGYKYERGKSLYRGEEVGEGGYVYAEPGIHRNVALLDIASMHPTSLECMCLFGPEYTKRFSDIKLTRILIKHEDFEEAGKLFDGKLTKYLANKEDAEALSYALKIAINSVYGLTSAKFDNPCRDPRNIDNIVAKRGALFMIDLKHEVQKRGYTVAHIKTDSIKIPDATPEIIQFVMDFGKYYGYTFEHEATYEKMCLVNDAVYIAKVGTGKKAGKWSPTGAQFAQPYVFKTLFSHEPIEFKDLCETKQVTGALYLDMNEDLPDVTKAEAELENLMKKIKKGEAVEGAEPRMIELQREIDKGHAYVFVGRIGSFVPIKPGCGGGLLMREQNGKYYAAGGTTGYRWLEGETVQTVGKEDDVDLNYHRSLVDAALEQIAKYGDVEEFLSDDIDIPPFCNKEDCATCEGNHKCHELAAAYAVVN